jgi:putative membrane protein
MVKPMFTIKNEVVAGEGNVTLDAQWRRSSFVATLNNAQMAMRILRRSYMEVGGVAVILFGLTKNLFLTVAILLGAAMSIVIISALLSYWFLRFKISQAHIEIMSGVFRRTHLNIPFERVQQLSTAQPLYYRWFGDFVDVMVDTAGSDDTEARLPAIRQQEFSKLQQLIAGCHHTASLDAPYQSQNGVDGHVRSEEDSDIIFKQNARSLLLYGVFQNKLLWFLALAVGFFEKFTEALSNIKKSLPEPSVILAELPIVDVDHVTWLAVVMVFAGLIVFLGISALLSLMEHYGFTLRRTSDGYLFTEGWLKKVMHRAAKRKIQGVVIRRNIAEAWGGRQNIIIEQFGASNVTLPCVDSAQITPLLHELCPGHQLSSVSLQRGNFLFVVKNWLLISLPLCALAYAFANAGPMNEDIKVLIYFTLFVSLGLALFHFLRWYRRAYAHDGQYLYLRRGRLVEKTMIIDKHKLQSASVSQNPLMKKLGLCTVTLYFSTGKFCIPYMPYQYGLALSNSSMDAVMRSNKQWI